MTGRPTIKTADINQLQKLNKKLSNMLNARPLMAYTMRYCGASYEEISMVFGVSRQMAKTLVEQAEREL